jgi:hypothetical protein
MRCPSCDGRLKYFSKFNFRIAKVKSCPYCNVNIKQSTNFTFFAIGFMPSIYIQLYILPPILMYFDVKYPSEVASFVVSFSFITLTSQFKLADTSTVNG